MGDKEGYITAKKFFLLCMIALLCTGCRPKDTADGSFPVVSEITVTCEQGGTLTRQVYTTQWKMRQILNSLRVLGQQSTPSIDPETLTERIYCITLYHTDGSQRIYQTRPDRFIRTERGPWKQADPKKVSELHLLLQHLPGDDPNAGLRRGIPRH